VCIEEEDMNVSGQVDTLQKRAADLKSSFDQARQETSEQVKARIEQTKTDIAAHENAAKDQAEQAAGRAQSQWKSMQADAAAKMQDLQDRIARKRDQHDVKVAEEDAEAAEEDAADALNYAAWAIDQAKLAVLDAVDARTWAGARAAASPSA
jgi:hypothetical protein